MKKIMLFICAAAVSGCMLSGCGNTTEDADSFNKVSSIEEETSDSAEIEAENSIQPEDGKYQAQFETDSSMFHVNEACNGMGTLTVENGQMVIHVSLVSKNIVNLYPGTAEDAQQADESDLLAPTTDTVTYSDGYSEEVYGFDIPVPALDEEFDLAILGAKGTWYDHKVSVSAPVEAADIAVSRLEDGEYSVEVVLEGGSGKSTVESPCTVRIENGQATAHIRWSSSHYDYMLVDGNKYLPVNEDGNSEFEIPVTVFDSPITVVGDTTAMSTPHEIEYTLTFDSASAEPLS